MDGNMSALILHSIQILSIESVQLFLNILDAKETSDNKYLFERFEICCNTEYIFGC